MAGFFLARPEGEEDDEAVKTQINIAQVMRDARHRKGWTQFDLAKRVGCSESQITKIETGRTSPEAWLKEAIARQLNISTWEVEASGRSATIPIKSNETKY